MARKKRIEFPRVWLIELRKSYKIKQIDIARALGLIRQNYEYLEKGIRMLSHEKMAEYFDVLSELFGISVQAIIEMETLWLEQRIEYAIKNNLHEVEE